MHIPKNFLTDIYLGDEGPLAGKRARPCYCQEPFDEGEEFVIMVFGADNIHMFHEHCVPAELRDDDA